MHEKYMLLALEEAYKAKEKKEVPIGAVIVKEGKVIASAHNLREQNKISTHHAEILAIEKACLFLDSWRLDGCTLYVTVEPCPMCSGAIIQSRIKTVVYGTKDYKAGCYESITNLFNQPFNHRVEVISGILEHECSTIIKDFFKDLRLKK